MAARVVTMSLTDTGSAVADHAQHVERSYAALEGVRNSHDDAAIAKHRAATRDAVAECGAAIAIIERELEGIQRVIENYSTPGFVPEDD